MTRPAAPKAGPGAGEGAGRAGASGAAPEAKPSTAPGRAPGRAPWTEPGGATRGATEGATAAAAGGGSPDASVRTDAPACALAGRARRLTALALALTGLGLLGYGLAAPAKARLGQILLDRAFERSVVSGAPERPWPWADMAPAARISFPRLGESRIVLDRASGEAMAWGPGLVAGLAPLGGPGLAAIAAHRDTHFALLAEVRPGDLIRVETRSGALLRYRVVGARVVDSRRVSLPLDRLGPERLVLSTCWPFDALTPGPMRFVLFAEPTAPFS